ncbi:MAG: 2'-5' RNA ligase family protein [Planctomycetes bacterium]|nr:2'-5' RNA ligase family protein [Planctomycetota bacterium]
MTAAFIALALDAGTTQAVLARKAALRELSGRQKYLDDPPHITLYLAEFPDLQPVATAVAEVAAATVQPQLHFRGWHVFMADALVGGNTLVCDLEAADRAPLERIQAEVIQRLSPMRDRTTTRDALAHAWPSLTPARRLSSETTGFPFTGDDWHPHVTIASIRTDDWARSWAALEPQALRLSGHAPELVLYRLDDDLPCRFGAWPMRRSS